MRHRLYYLLPDIESARHTLDDFLAKGALPEDMPEANFLQKTDVVHGAKAGMLTGAVLGMALGFLVVYYFSLSSGALAVTAASLVVVIFCGLWGSLVAAAILNTRLAAFFPEIEKGRVLLIADVPARRIEQIERVLAERHPEINFRGEEPTIPAFP